MHTIYIPVEVKARAWTAKLILAAELAEKGFAVVIGSSRIVLEKALMDTNGIYIEKDFYYLRYTDMKKLKDRGFLLYAYDEEGVVYVDDNWYVDSRTHEDMLMLCDKVFTWGEAQEKLLRNAYPFVNNFCTAGNPRIDLVTGSQIEKIYEDEIKQVKKTGRYILINSNFSSYGNPEKSAADELLTDRQHGKEDKVSGYQELLTEYYSCTDRIFDSLADAVVYIAKRIDMKIVVRIHPSENMDKWKKVSMLDNVKVVSRFDANPWIYCSEAVIHNFCTTAIEGYLSGKIIISYSPYHSKRQTRQLPDDISVMVKDRKQLLEAIERFVVKGEERPDRNEILGKHIFLKNGVGCANHIIIDQIISDSQNVSRSTVKIKENLFWNLIDPIMEFRDKFRETGRKFPYESKKNMKKRLNKIQACKGISEMKILHIGRNVFCLKSSLGK